MSYTLSLNQWKYLELLFFYPQGKYIDIHVIIGKELYGVTIKCHALDQNVLGSNHARFFPSARKLTTIASPNSYV